MVPSPISLMSQKWGIWTQTCRQGECRVRRKAEIGVVHLQPREQRLGWCICRQGSRDWGGACAAKRHQRLSMKPRKKHGTDYSSHHQKEPACQHSDLGLAFRTVRHSVVYTTQFVIFGYSSPWKLIKNVSQVMNGVYHLFIEEVCISSRPLRNRYQEEIKCGRHFSRRSASMKEKREGAR